MEADPPGQRHRHDVEDFIGERPADRPQGKLHDIDGHRGREREPDALTCQNLAVETWVDRLNDTATGSLTAESRSRGRAVVKMEVVTSSP